MNEEYAAFLAGKAVRATDRGIPDVPELAPHLFQFQRHCVEFALRAGSAGLFLDTGTGKTECQLEWCHQAVKAVGGKSLILTPLAVAGQTKRRADRWGYEARVIRHQSDAGPGINICNYDRLDTIDPSQFSVVSLDEASILKSMSGKMAHKIIDAFKGHRFRLASTATPAPNDHMEIANYAEFLGVMSASEMLSRFFINDASTASQTWRLKGHAEHSFWDWMASWARMAEKPGDLGDPGNDERFILPELKMHRHTSRNSDVDQDLSDLFGGPALSATNIHALKRQTIDSRAERVAALIHAEPEMSWVIWVDTDYEADAVRRQVPKASEVRGSMTIDEKEARLAAFETGQSKYLVAKPAACGFGMDWSHCSRMAFVGRSYSYETWYQAVRRCWRFGQKEIVNVHIIVAEGESEIGRVIDRKAGDHATMKASMRSAMSRAMGHTSTVKSPYNPEHEARLVPWLASVV